MLMFSWCSCAQAAAILVRAPVGDDDAYVARPYTPLSSADQSGFMTLMVKSYPDGVCHLLLVCVLCGEVWARACVCVM